jgi:P27 family predicted phage terminase small subunit
MGSRGRKPEPAAVKKAKGNPGRRRLGEDPKLDAGESAASLKVDAPAWLKDRGREIWDRLAPRLIGMKLLAAIDAEAFARYCRNYARWHAMQETLDSEGETYESESQHGKLKRAHPAFLISDRLERQLQAVEDRFGLNPAERQRLFAARAAVPRQGELFGGSAAEPRPGAQKRRSEGGNRPSASALKPASPVGFLN